MFTYINVEGENLFNSLYWKKQSLITENGKIKAIVESEHFAIKIVNALNGCKMEEK